MSQYLILRDTRLRGFLPITQELTITCNLNRTTPLFEAFSSITNAYMCNLLEKINTIFILCHGFAGNNERAGVCLDAGGMGLQLGRSNVLHKNVHFWETVKNRARNIVVYACAAANTEIGNEGTHADGRYLMGALALHTNANVYAADRMQSYHPHNFKFGTWEGQLYHFSPTTGQPRAVRRAPTELSEI